MATRENQGLQAVVIVLSILFLVAVVVGFLLNNARKTQFARAESAEQQRNTATQQQAQAQADASELKAIAGFAETDTLETVRTTLTEEMNAMGVPEDADSRKYRTVLARFVDENSKLVGNNSDLKAEVKTLKDRLLAVEAQKDEQVKKFEEERDKARQDLADEREKFDVEYKRINAAKDDIDKQMVELKTSHETALADLEKQKRQLEIQIDTLTLSIDKLRQGVPNPDQFAQPADGQITSVDQGGGVAWVNIGSADGLRPQVTFAVAEAGLEDAAAAEKKGSIEITQVVGPHLSEARITEDDPTNPLVPRDRIFSQVWDRGRQVGFGIAGFVDLDKDGKDDLTKLKTIIAASGGIVDAAPDETGAKQGELKVSTRYLILGEYPSDTRLGTLRTSWTELSNQANDLGIDTIALDEFLSLIGWRSEARSVPMGPGARAEDFPPQARTQEMPRKTGQPAGVFKKRFSNAAY